MLPKAAIGLDAVDLDFGRNDHLTVHAIICLCDNCRIVNAYSLIYANFRHIKNIGTRNEALAKDSA
jgi:hypothetical protein